MGSFGRDPDIRFFGNVARPGDCRAPAFDTRNAVSSSAASCRNGPLGACRNEGARNRAADPAAPPR